MFTPYRKSLVRQHSPFPQNSPVNFLSLIRDNTYLEPHVTSPEVLYYPGGSLPASHKYKYSLLLTTSQITHFDYVILFALLVSTSYNAILSNQRLSDTFNTVLWDCWKDCRDRALMLVRAHSNYIHPFLVFMERSNILMGQLLQLSRVISNQLSSSSWTLHKMMRVSCFIGNGGEWMRPNCHFHTGTAWCLKGVLWGMIDASWVREHVV